MAHRPARKVGDAAYESLTGQDVPRRGVDWFLAFMCFIVGFGLGFVVACAVAYYILTWAARYEGG